MRIKSVLISTFIVAATFFCGCSKSRDTISGPSGDENLLINSSFEIDTVPSFQEWFVSDSSEVSFSEDTPPSGGNWSVTMGPGWIPMVNFISKTIAAPEGTHGYKFSFWAKKHAVGGWIELILEQRDTSVVYKSMSISDSAWAIYSFLDTLSANVGDSLVIKLTGGSVEVGLGETYYDLVRLEKLD